ncbi:MAG TPA: hypothetical protein VHS78_13675 [Candidatus Elarobacter sp.]|jgi:hypothetical protein|nr:hypothetical protein [Candidatus Elarobacter sp.]
MRRKTLRRILLLWSVGQIAARMFLEHVATVWLLGSAPFLAHLAIAEPARGYGWIPNDLYLFFMVAGGTLAMEAFQDRRRRAPFRTMAGVAGAFSFSAGAWAYASLEAGTSPIDGVLRSSVYVGIAGLSGIDVIYRIPKMIGDAMNEHAREGPR